MAVRCQDGKRHAVTVDNELVATVVPARMFARLAATRPFAVGALVTFAVGSGLGWLFRLPLLDWLIDPWVDPNVISESIPGREQVFRWFLLVILTMGALLALPFLALLVGSFFARLPRASTPAPLYFVCSSYLAIAAGLSLLAMVAFPAFHAEQRANSIGVVPWAYVEFELYAVSGVALTFQLLVLLLAFATARFLSPSLKRQPELQTKRTSP